MTGRSLTLATLLLLFTGSAYAQPVDLTLDPNHSEISFTARHLGFSKVRGTFKKVAVTKASADAKTGKLSALEAEADTASIDTGVTKVAVAQFGFTDTQRAEGLGKQPP